MSHDKSEIDLTIYQLPTAHLKGDGTDNPVEELQYNNVIYFDYQNFLKGWLSYYDTLHFKTQNDKEHMKALKAELDRVTFEGDNNEIN